MDPTIEINQRVGVMALFRDKDSRESCVPLRMSYRGRDVVFEELGLRHPTVAGKRMLHIFDMSDGTNDYRLSFDAESLAWTLISMIEGHHARP